MANGGRIDYTIGFNVDKSGLNELKSQLDALAKTTPTDLMKLNPGVFKDARKDAQSALYYIKQDLKSVQTAFNDAFNPTTGLMNLQKLNTALNQIGADKLSKTFGMLGQKGQDAFYQMTKSALTTNMQLKQTNTLLNKMGTTLMNTLKWTLSSGLINRITGTLSQAVGYVEHLDSSLNDIRIVTKKSADEMDTFAVKANKAAQALGRATTDYTEAALIYYQQGLGDEEVQARAETTLKAANVTGQAASAVSEQLTAVWNGFRVNAEQTEEYVDKLAAVAAMSASNLEELSTGMSKVASAAANLGVDIDQLTAQISTIVSVTRQAPESVGTALKTIYARISDLKLGESDEDGLGLGDVSGGLKKLGIEVLDSEGELRDLGTVIEEVATKWDSWTSAQQAAIAQLMAGKRQYNNLVALFNNWDMYTNAIETSRNATGELQKQQDIYMESAEAHLQQMKTQWEDLYDSILDSDAIKSFSDSITSILKLLTNFVDGIGGGRNALLLLGSTLTRVFSKQISQGIVNIIGHFSRMKENAVQLQAQLDNIQLFKNTQQYESNPAVKALVDAQHAVSQYYGVLSNEQINTANALAQQVGDAAQLEQEWEDSAQAVNEYMKAVQAQNNGKKIKVTKDDGSISREDYSNFSFKDTKSAIQLKGIEQSLDKTETKFKNFNKQINIFSKMTVKAEKDSGYFIKNMNTIQKSAGSALNKFQDLNKEGIFKNVQPSKLNEIEKALNEIQASKSTDDFTSAVSRLEAAMEGLDPVAKRAIQDLRQLVATGNNVDFSAASKQLDEFLKKANLQQVTNNIVNSIGAIGQFAGSINSLKNSFDVLGDSSLSAGEKITQFISSAGMGITMLLSSGSRLIAGYKGLNAAMNALNMAKVTQILENKHLLTEQGALTVTGAKLIGVEYSDAAATDAQNIAKLKQIGIQRTLNPLLLAATGIIIGLTAVITTSIAKYKEMREEVKKNAEATIELKNKEQESIDKRKEEVNGIQDLIDQYKKGKISIQEFNDKKLEFIGTIDGITEAIARQADSWEDAQKQLDNYYAKLAEKSITKQKEKRNEGLKQALADMDVGTDTRSEIDKEGNYSYHKALGTLENSEVESEYYKALQDAKFITEGKKQGRMYRSLEFTITPDEEGLKKVQELFALQEKYKNKAGVQDFDTYKYIDEIYKKYQESEGKKTIGEANEVIKESEITQAVSNAELNLQTTTDGLREQKEIFLNELKNSSLTEEEKIQAWKDYLTKSTNKAAKELVKEENNLTRMMSSWQYFVPPEGETIENTDAYKKAFRVQQQLLQKGFTADQIGKVDPEVWDDILFGDLSDKQIIQQGSIAIREAVNKSLISGFNDFKGQAEGVENNLQTIIASAISGNVDIGEDSPYAKILDYLDTIKQYYPELSDEVATFTNTGIIGTEKWINSAYTLQKAFSDLELTKKSDDLNKKIKSIADYYKEGYDNEGYDDRGFKLHVKVDTEDFTEAIDEIMDEDYNITIEIGADIEDSFNNLVNGMEKADNMAAKIGENFIVSAEDITEIADAFPGILEGYTDLGNGTIQLNQEIAKSAMDAANQAEIASTEELVTEIKNTNTKLQVKKNHYDNIVKIAAKAAKTEDDVETEKAQIIKELQDIEKENQEILSQSKIDNAKTVADNSNENAAAVGANWEEGYQKAADAAITEAQIAIENAKRIAEANRQAAQGGPVTQTAYGQGTSLVKVWSGGKQGVGTQINTDSTGLKDQGDLTNKEYFTQIQEEAQKQSDLLEKEINANSAMAAEAAARLGKSVTSNNAVGSIKEDNKDSSKGSEKEAQHMDNIEREEDIYREINTELENYESTLKRIQTIDEHSWGASQKKALQEEQKLLDKQIATLERKQKMQVGDLSTRRKQLEDVGVTFSSDGSVMTNAESVLNQLYAGYNQMTQRYNNMSAAEQDAYKAQMDTEKNRIDAIEKAIGEYESGYSDLQGTLDELQSKHYEQIETNVREFNHDIDVHLELSDAKKEWNDFWEEIVEDVDDNDFGKKIAGSMKQLENLVGLGGSGSGIVGELTNHLTETVDMVQAQLARASSGGDGVFEDDTAASHDNLVKYRDELMSALRDAKNEVDEIRENYFNMLDEAQEKMDKQKKGWENIRKQLEHNANLIKLIDGENAYDALNKQYELRHKNNLETIETNKQSAEWWKQRMENAKRVLETTDKNSQEWKDASKEYEVASENYIKNLDDFNQSVEQALEDINEQIELLTNQTFDKLEKSLTKGLGFDTIEDEWKLINDYANSYFDNVERYLNMEEYTNTLNDAANAIGLSAENQQKLNEFRDQELDKLRSLNKLTAYDIEESKARLEIMKAQMALEDVQRNKSNLRLRRDSQGNYNYQYVENADAVDEANQNSLAAQKAWYEIVKKQNLDLKEQRIQATKDVVEYTKKANEALRAGDIERYNKYTELAATAEERVKFIQEQAAKNSKDLYDGVAQYFDNVNEAHILKQNEATISKLMDEWVGGGEESFTGALTTAFNELQRINEEYGKKTKDVLDQAGIDYERLRNTGLDPTIDTLQTLVDTNEAFKDMLDETSDSLAEQERNLRNAEDAYNDLKEAAVQAIEAANNALSQLATTAVSAATQVTAAINAAKQASAISYNTVSPSSSTGGSGTGSSNNGSGGSNNSYADNTPYEITIADKASGNTNTYSAFRKSDIYSVMAPYATGKYVEMWVTKGTNRADMTGNLSKDELRKKVDAIRFDTGGYTGSWPNNNGRLAMLHQKELVLNASDTKNMLSAVEILRSLPIEALAKSIIASSSNIASSFASGVNVSGITGGVTNNDSKNMVINADFSGVSSADEIYKAFLSLENYGIQQSYSVIPNIN